MSVINDLIGEFNKEWQNHYHACNVLSETGLIVPVCGKPGRGYKAARKAMQSARANVKKHADLMEDIKQNMVRLYNAAKGSSKGTIRMALRRAHLEEVLPELV